MKALRSVFEGRTWRAAAASLAAASLLVACGGGGGGVGTVGTGEAASYASGRISGLGSIIVNGVRYDDSSATITDDDGVTYDADDLKLGMVVEIEGGRVTRDTTTGTATASASSVQFASEIKGSVEAVDVAGETLTVLGQVVEVDAATMFDGFVNRLAGVQAGDLVEIHAFFDVASGTYQATRIEQEDGLDEFKLRGTVADLDTAAETFTLGGATVSYADIPAGDLPELSNGLAVRVEFETTPQAGMWVATEIRARQAREIDDDTEAEVEGVVTDFVSLADFKVNGIAVNAGGSGVEFEDGTSADVVQGARVEVEGTVRSGVLVATKVEIEAGDNDDDVDSEVELHGAIESLDSGSNSFVLRGLTVTYSGSTVFDDGIAADLGVGVQVEVKGTLAPSGAGIDATEIDFED